MPRIISLDCIHELPSDYADLCDADYLCPVIVIATRATGPPWEPPGLKDTVYDNIIVGRNRAIPGYTEKYGHYDYHVKMDKEEITEDDCAEALEQLNGVLEKRSIDYRFTYDGEIFEDTPITGTTR